MSSSIGQKFTPFTLIKFAFPSMVMMVFMSLYTIVDGIFISRFVGSDALSASNIVYPVLNILMAMSVMIATGGSAVVGKELGEGDFQTARKHFTFFAVVGIMGSILILGVVFLLTDPLCHLLGSNDALLPYCRDYLRTIILFAPACVLQNLFQCFFVTAGKPHYGLFVIVSGGIANAILDYYFMAVLHMGVGGAALATGIGQLIPAVFGLIYFCVSKGELLFCRFSFDLRAITAACFNGSSEMVTNLSNGIITYLFNIILMKLAGADGVAAITILLYSQFLFNSLYMGFSMGVAPIFSYQFGAKRRLDLQNTEKISRWFVLISSVVVTSLSFLLAVPIVSIFVTPGTNVHALAVQGFSIFSFCFLFSGTNIFASSLFTALSDGKTSAIISFSRTLLFISTFLIVLPTFFGIVGAWLAVPLAEFISIFLVLYFRRKLPF